MYMATKSLVDAMHLDAVAAECYPAYSGLMNQTASWLFTPDFYECHSLKASLYIP